ncbi:MAG: hypothetical protein V1781_03870 [Bacteroidota bacterium]
MEKKIIQKNFENLITDERDFMKNVFLELPYKIASVVTSLAMTYSVCVTSVT